MSRLTNHVHGTDDTSRVTTLELLFDLVFVYALTQVTSFMAHDLSGRGLARGMVLLVLLWFAWAAYSWLGNQARADEGPLRVSLIAAMGGLFVVALAMPEAFRDAPGGLPGPVVFAVAYAVVRVVHLVVYGLAAGADSGLRRQVARAALVGVPPLVLLAVGAVAGPPWQIWWWVAAVVVDLGGMYAIGSAGWRLNSARHFAERHGLIVIIAIGESIVSIGLGLAGAPISVPLLAGSLLGITIAVCLWWTYFDVVALVAEQTLEALSGSARAAMARDSYSYLHLPMVAGIVLLALGTKLALQQAIQTNGEAATATLPSLATWALYGGTAMYLLGHVAFRLRNVRTFNWHRSLVAVLLIVMASAAAVTATDPPAMLQLGLVAALLTALVGYEMIRFAGARRVVRHVEPAT